MVTLEKAKEILGDTANNMSDEQVVKTVGHMYKLANFMIDRFIAMTPDQRKVLDKKIELEKTS
jgi:hypothetical protein